MNFEKYFDKLPNFIKYNRFIFNLFLKLSYKLRKINDSNNQLNSQNQLFNLLFTSCDIKIKGTQRDLQLLYLELLRFIDNICNKYDIDYWLDYGTLLGAVRHGGFIPWDDDIDLSIMRNDYEKLIEVLPNELSKYPKLKDNIGISLIIENNENYFSNFKSVYDIEGEKSLLNDYKFSFLQIAWLKPYVKIDLFPKDYLLSNNLDQFSKNYISTKYKLNKELQKGNIDYKRVISTMYSELGLTNTFSEYYANTFEDIDISEPCIYETKSTFPLKTIKFEGYEFKSPCNVDKHLKVKFGDDYMKIPNIIENHDIIPFIKSQFESTSEMKNYFDDAISFLKMINDNYE